MTPEKKVKAAIKTLLKEQGAWFYMPVPTGFSGASIDFFVCYRGRFYGIEAKRPGVTTPTALQTCVMRDIATAGGGVCVENDTACPKVREMLNVP